MRKTIIISIIILIIVAVIVSFIFYLKGQESTFQGSNCIKAGGDAGGDAILPPGQPTECCYGLKKVLHSTGGIGGWWYTCEKWYKF